MLDMDSLFTQGAATTAAPSPSRPKRLPEPEFPTLEPEPETASSSAVSPAARPQQETDFIPALADEQKAETVSAAEPESKSPSAATAEAVPEYDDSQLRGYLGDEIYDIFVEEVGEILDNFREWVPPMDQGA
ncbi:MAG: hypothetical protein R3E95_15205 [Thiolinea sp.]